MITFTKKQSLGFNDVHIISERPSRVSSRADITIPMNRIIMAPMHAIQGITLIKSAIIAGISVPVHRFNTLAEQKVLFDQAVYTKDLVKSKSQLWLSVGLNDWKERYQANLNMIKSSGAGLLIDVANGFSFAVAEEIEKMRVFCGDEVSIFAGNVHSAKGFTFLDDLGIDHIRCGIGGGEACLTTPVTGVGRGQMTVIQDIDTVIRHASLVSDGAIRSSSDLAKAFLAGADYVMIGGMFKHAAEAECVINKTPFFGGASATAKKSVGLPVRNVEGAEIPVDMEQVKPLQKILDELTDGLRSAISYSGFASLEEAIGNGTFEQV